MAITRSKRGCEAKDHSPFLLVASMNVAAEYAEQPRLAGVRVLLVEDDVHHRPVLERLLRESGAEVRSVGRVREALAALVHLPDIIILDVHLPDGTGLEVAEAASQLRAAPGIIAVSGEASPQETFA